MLTTSLLIGFAAALTAMAYALWSLPPANPASDRSAKDNPMDAALWPTGWPHEAPETPLTIDEAHQTMQRHCNCLREECPRKDAAWTTLVFAGHIKPDTHRELAR